MALNPIPWSEVKVLFELRRGPIQTLLSQPGVSWKAIKNISDPVAELSGYKGVTIPSIVGAGHGVGAAFPAHKSMKFANPKFDIVDWYVRLEIDAKTQRISKELIDAMLSVREEESVWHLNQMLFRDGSGIIAKVIDVAGDKSYITIAPVYCDDTVYPGAADRYFRVGMLVDTYTSAGVAHDAGIQITAVDTVNHYLYGNWDDTAADDYIYLNLSKTYGEFVGFEGAIHESSVYGGVDPADAPVWKSVVLDLNNSALSAKILLNFCAELNSASPGASITHIITSPAVAAAYSELFKESISMLLPSYEKKVADIGIGGYKLTTPYAHWGKNGVIDIIADAMCTEGTMYFIAGDTWYHLVVDNFDWIPGEPEFGGIFRHAMVAEKDSLIALGVLHHTLYTKARNANGKIKGIKIS